MADAGSPLKALLSSRYAFGSTSEALELVEMTDRRLRLGNVTWLEIGAGDGQNLRFQLDRLSAERSLNAVALEPAAIIPPALGNVEWIMTRAEDYTTERRFDWISMRHSAYYLVNLIDEIARFAAMLCKEGTLALTHWSRDCILYRLHVAICGDPSEVACAGIEDLAAKLRDDPRLEVSQISMHEAHLDIDRVMADNDLCCSIYELSRRGRATEQMSDKKPRAIVARLLSCLPSASVRRNGILFLRAR